MSVNLSLFWLHLRRVLNQRQPPVRAFNPDSCRFCWRLSSKALVLSNEVVEDGEPFNQGRVLPPKAPESLFPVSNLPVLPFHLVVVDDSRHANLGDVLG